MVDIFYAKARVGRGGGRDKKRARAHLGNYVTLKICLMFSA